MNHVDDIIRQLETQKAAINRALEALREVGGDAYGGHDVSPIAAVDKRSVAQKARWAAKRAAEGPTVIPAKATRKGGISAAGRKALAEAMKRRWAVKRSNAQAKAPKKTPRKAA